ncbi:MAG: polysaccharide pyruvyl transferase family protein [Planctomycetota bacterium]
MKVGILTFHWSYNFGANLQALATQNALKSLGVEPVIVNYRDPNKVAHYRKITDPAQAEMHESFCREYLNESEVLTNSDEIEQFCNDSLDAVLVGSDAVFSLVANNSPRQWIKRVRSDSDPIFTMGRGRSISPYFLPWKSPTDVKRGSIAASSTGTQFYFLSLRHYGQAWRALRNFDSLSVRDRWTRWMVRTLTLGTRNPQLVVDPVFSLNTHSPDFVQSIDDADNTVLLSGNFQDDWIESLAEELGDHNYQLVNLPNPDASFENPHLHATLSLPMGPREWFSRIAHASGFVGIRFHALVSSIVNRTPFISVDIGPPALRPLYRLGSKYHDLCQRADCTSRYFDKNSIYRIPPSVLSNRLMDESTRAKADQFAEIAATEFDRTLQTMLESFDMKTNPAAVTVA